MVIGMSDCCIQKKTSGIYPKSHLCPVNGKSYDSVNRKTLLHHITHPWRNSITEQGYYFCTDPFCDVVYFGQDDNTVSSSALRDTVWQKSKVTDAMICYCFGVTKAQALSDKSIKSFIIEQTKNALCSCETSNPSGHCCLKDFPKS